MSSNGHTGNKPNIILIHGLWLTPKSWKGWIDRYQRAGYNVVAPAWPGLEGGMEALRKDPTPLKGLTIKKVVDHYDRIIRSLETPPILIGHSFGGLIVQILLDRGLGGAGVVIDSAQTAGVVSLPLSTLRATLKVLANPFTFNSAVSLSPKEFHYAFTNDLDDAESQRVYDELQIPGAGRILWEGALSLLNPNGASKVDYKKNNRAPLLFIAGGNDHLVPPAINKANVRKYVTNSSAITDYREFPNRTHNTVGQKGWEEVADFALQWAVEHIHPQVTLADLTAAFGTDESMSMRSEVRPQPPEARA